MKRPDVNTEIEHRDYAGAIMVGFAIFILASWLIILS